MSQIAPTLGVVSKTERDLSPGRRGDALDEMFTDEDFDSAFHEAIEHADLELDISDLESTNGDESGESTRDHDAHDHAGHTGEQALVGRGDRETADVDLAGVDVAGVDLADVDRLLGLEPATPVDEPEARIRPAVDPDPDLDPDDDDGISDGILEELREADIDGPVVPHAPQDDTTAAVRRPRRAADYDPAPVPIPAKVPRILGRKPRVRKVTRVVRHVDPWTVFKIAIVAHLVLYVIMLTASVLLWNVANATGTIDNVERFFESFGWNSFEFDGGELYHAGWIAGLFIVIGFTGLAVLTATLFNLITDLVGGMRFTVLEEEVVETRTSPMRRFVVRRPEPEVPALLHDSSGAMYREAVVDDTGANQRPTR